MMTDVLKRQLIQAELKAMSLRLRDLEARLRADPNDAAAQEALLAEALTLNEYIGELRALDRAARRRAVN